MKTIRILLTTVLFVNLFISCSSDDDAENISSKIDKTFVGTWNYNNYVANVVDENHNLIFNINGTCSYSWSRITATSWQKDTYWDSEGTWEYDKTNKRIITTCTTSSTGSTVILDVISVNETTLVVKQEGASKSKTYTKKN